MGDAGGIAIAGAQTLIAGYALDEQKKQANKAEAREIALKAEMDNLARQPIINPYEGVTNLSEMASDLSGMLSNPFNSLGVATAASEMQAEQTDIALANTLDTLRATGASAGGATALARMALESKKGISADIERQEAANQKLRASGEETLLRSKMAEAQRQQTIGMSEAQRLQTSDVASKQFKFREQETREMTELDRLQAQITGQAQAASQARSDMAQTGSSLVTALGNIDSSIFSKKTDTSKEVDPK
tara:strand:- start:2102 stop:2845 length:744 start_codon:yes stop_codon:yes gene_type:complete